MKGSTQPKRLEACTQSPQFYAVVTFQGGTEQTVAEDDGDLVKADNELRRTRHAGLEGRDLRLERRDVGLQRVVLPLERLVRFLQCRQLVR